MKRPSLIALPLPEATRALGQAGIGLVEVIHTAPPGGRPGGPERVVRERYSAEGAQLTVADTIRGPGRQVADG
jgi:hypothetical protein